jgi:putative nucleotidyltransferase with HDIG domain
MGHCTLTTFYAAAITKNLEWGSDAIVEKVTMGAILHDIGKLKLSKDLQDKRPEVMTPEELAQYKLHSQWGYELVKNIKYVPMPVKQIIQQHHEVADGSGFPNGLQSMSIYPPAKIVAFANFFAHYLVDQKKKPIDAFQQLLKSRDIINLFDAEVVKALIKGFIIKGQT